MNMLCTICNLLIIHVENIYVTKCGHIFHFHCLSQWISSSKTCPQCRNQITKRSIFRVYPTITNEVPGAIVTMLRSRLDDTLLQLRKQTEKFNEHKDLLIDARVKLHNHLQQKLSNKEELRNKDLTIFALEEQIKQLKLVQNEEVSELKEENESLKKNIQTLNSLQKVLNATSDDVEQMLEGYTDIRTVAKLATALKRELCESKSKENESRDRLQAVKEELHFMNFLLIVLQAKLLVTEEKAHVAQKNYEYLMKKRKALENPNRSFINDSQESSIKQMKPNEELNSGTVLNDTNTSFPSEHALLNSTRNAISILDLPSTSKTSIFHKKEQAKIQLSQENDPNLSSMNIAYDGLGGHSKLDTFPVPNTRQPLKSLVHNLRQPAAAGNQDISNMLEKEKTVTGKGKGKGKGKKKAKK
ncbi:unnamed protein product [Euphydryas editha]|uniref:RING-type domain-containing protein n=1 Tax=Euphydryas editha TaxID=104508 RepID=A0AAU9UBG1_EUPED|nr:unnamed protein product [Euphydryas editha]